MKISVRVLNSRGQHQASVSTNDIIHALKIAPKASGYGSSINTGELLFLALSTCFCNDLYREAAKQGIQIEQVEVEVEGEFGEAGEPAQNVTYNARVTANAVPLQIRQLAELTDRLAEIHNTLRTGVPVTLGRLETVMA